MTDHRSPINMKLTLPVRRRLLQRPERLPALVDQLPEDGLVQRRLPRHLVHERRRRGGSAGGKVSGGMRLENGFFGLLNDYGWSKKYLGYVTF